MATLRRLPFVLLFQCGLAGSGARSKVHKSSEPVSYTELDSMSSADASPYRAVAFYQFGGSRSSQSPFWLLAGAVARTVSNVRARLLTTRDFTDLPIGRRTQTSYSP